MRALSPFREDGELAESFQTVPFTPPGWMPYAENEAAVAGPPAVRADRLEVAHVRLLAGHRGNPPDIVLRWNDMPSTPSEVDVVVHLHGNSVAHLSLPHDIERYSGLDLAPVDGEHGHGRTRPTLTVLPRGNFTGRLQRDGSRYVYTFPALEGPDGLTRLGQFALEAFAAKTGLPTPARARLILTAHSHGGEALLATLRHHDPDEVHVFDALYWPPGPLVDWARARMSRDRAALASLGPSSAREYMSTRGGALRVFYLTTPTHSRELRAAIEHEREPTLADWYRVEASTYGHMDIPRQYGWRILTDVSADVPRIRRAPAARHETDIGDESPESESPPLNDLPELPAEEEWEHEESDPVGAAPAYEVLSAAFEAPDLWTEAQAWEFEDTEDLDVEHGEAEAFLEDLYSREAAFEEETTGSVTFPSGATLRVVSAPTGKGQEHWDPHDTKNPVLDTREPVRSMRLSKDFTVRDLLGGHDFDKARIDPKLVEALQKLRDHVGAAVHVRSGYRPYTYNVDLYTKRYKRQPTLSYHSSGQAADVKIGAMTGMEIAKAAIDTLGTNIGVGIDHDNAHIDVRGFWAKWTYFQGDENARALKEIEDYHHRHARPLAPPAASSTAQPLQIVEALGRGLWDVAVRLAIDSGITDVNQLTNTIFYFRHPDMRGRQIGPDQRDLAHEWIEIRDRWVVPALATHPSAHPSPAQAHGRHGRSEDQSMARVYPLLQRHRGDIPLDFLLGWVYVESGGVNDLPPTKNLGELGYFQISREESHMLGVDHERIANDPDYSVMAGTKLVQHYADLARTRFPSVPYGTELFWRIVKFIHAMGSGDAPSLLRQMQRDGVELSSWDAVSHYAAAEGDRLVRLKILKRHPTRFIANVDKVYSDGRGFAVKLSGS